MIYTRNTEKMLIVGGVGERRSESVESIKGELQGSGVRRVKGFKGFKGFNGSKSSRVRRVQGFKGSKGSKS